MKKKSAISSKKDHRPKSLLEAASITQLFPFELLREFPLLALANYIKEHPDVEFTFKYEPDGIGMVIPSNRKFVCKFSKNIKCSGYATENFEQLIYAIINESN